MTVICCLRVVMRFLLIGVVVTNAAEPAYEVQPVNGNGTTIANPVPKAVLTSPFTLSGMYV